MVYHVPKLVLILIDHFHPLIIGVNQRSFSFHFTLWLLGQSRDHFISYFTLHLLGQRRDHSHFSFSPFDCWVNVEFIFYFLTNPSNVAVKHRALFYFSSLSFNCWGKVEIIYFSLFIFSLWFLVPSFMIIYFWAFYTLSFCSIDWLQHDNVGTVRYSISTFQHDYVISFVLCFCFSIDSLQYDNVAIMRCYSHMYLWHDCVDLIIFINHITLHTLCLFFLPHFVPHEYRHKKTHL